MKTTILICCLFLTSLMLKGQSEETLEYDPFEYMHIGFDGHMGLHSAVPEVVSPNAIGYQKTPDFLEVVGGAFKGISVGTEGEATESSMRYDRFVPLTLLETDQDALTFKGWTANFASGSDLFPKQRWLDLMLYGEFGFGRMKILHTYADGTENAFTNPVVTVGVSTELRLSFKPRSWKAGFGAGARAGYNRDLSKSHWRDKDGDGYYLYRHRLTGYGLQAFASFLF